MATCDWLGCTAPRAGAPPLYQAGDPARALQRFCAEHRRRALPLGWQEAV